MMSAAPARPSCWCRVVQHRRRVAPGYLAVGDLLPFRDDEPARIWRDGRAPHDRGRRYLPRGRDPRSRHPARGIAGASRRPFLRRPGRARGRAQEPGAACCSLVIIEAPAPELLRHGRASALSRLPGDDRRLFPRVPRRRARRRSAAMIDFYGGAGHLRLLAAAGSRLRRRDDGGQHPGLDQRPIVSRPTAGVPSPAIISPLSSLRGADRHPAVKRAMRARVEHAKRLARDDGWSLTFHACDPSRERSTAPGRTCAWRGAHRNAACRRTKRIDQVHNLVHRSIREAILCRSVNPPRFPALR